MEPVSTAFIALFVLLAVVFTLAPVILELRDRRALADYTSDDRLPGPDKLFDEPEQLEALGETVQRVVVISVPTGVTSEGGGGTRPHIQAFVVDEDGETRQFVESNRWQEVEQPARRLAEHLDVPFDNKAYGG